MSVDNSILEQINENCKTINALKLETSTLVGQYVKSQATKNVHEVIDKIKIYLEKHYIVDSDFIDLLRANITMVPITSRISRITKYNTRVFYDTVLYEWNGKRIMYIRADPNSDNYYKECDDFNGFEIDPSDFDCDERYYTWWKTDTDVHPEYKVEHAIEKVIKSTRSSSSRNYNDYIVGIPDMFKIIVVIFDLINGYPYLIGEDILPRDYDFLPPHST